VGISLVRPSLARRSYEDISYKIGGHQRVSGGVRLYSIAASVKFLQARSCRDSERGLADGRLALVIVDNPPPRRYYSPIMASERVQRQIDRLLDEAEQASD